jgi:hypothetical protein
MSDAPTSEPAAELRHVDAELARLKAELDELEERFADHLDDPADGIDRVEALTAIEEYKALIEVLRGYREDLRQRIERGGGADPGGRD